MRDVALTFTNTTAASLDESYVMPRRPNDGQIDLQLVISASANVTIYGRLTPDQPWLALSASAYTASAMMQRPWVPLLRVVVSGNTGTVSLVAWAV